MFEVARDYPSPLDEAARRRHGLRNVLHTAALIGAGVVLLALTAWSIFGVDGILWAALAGGIGLFLSSRITPDIVLRLFRARPLPRHVFPDGWRVLEALAKRAGLPRTPRFFYVPSSNMNAFAVGRPGNAAVAVTDGLIRGLTLRQFAAVIAHEISHVSSGDVKVMALADMITRLTNAMATLGLIMLVLYFPAMTGEGHVPWLGIILMIFAPTLAGLLQLALSRAREYDADLDAVGLTGDPEGLALALLALEKKQGALWEGLTLPGGRIPDPSLLRSHPKTEERVRRLRALHPPKSLVPLSTSVPVIPPGYGPVTRRPRYRMSGVWY
jgi:heat shock protein HtpX